MSTAASRPNPHRATVPLDELLENLTPEMVAEIHHRAPAGLVDQLAAAHRDSVALIEAIEDRPVRYVPRSSVDDWLRLGLLDTFLTWVSGNARVCLHAPDFRRPEPVWAAAWKPGLVVCPRCTRQLKVFGDADAACDRCGRVTLGVEHDDGIYTLSVMLGALTYQAGACRDCLPEDADP
ncbi:MAG: hypothetical protein ACLQIK_08385 [Mycobacterium sp.]|uniref:hypothetical protein n=1 Tax=Mycobacterium sp. TaxID=1785 RepID=UPI003F9EA722